MAQATPDESKPKKSKPREELGAELYEQIVRAVDQQVKNDFSYREDFRTQMGKQALSNMTSIILEQFKDQLLRLMSHERSRKILKQVSLQRCQARKQQQAPDSAEVEKALKLFDITLERPPYQRHWRKLEDFLAVPREGYGSIYALTTSYKLDTLQLLESLRKSINYSKEHDEISPVREIRKSGSLVSKTESVTVKDVASLLGREIMEVLPDITGTSGDTPTFVTFRLKVQNKSRLEPSTDLCHIAPPLPSITNLSASNVQPPECVTLENSLARGGARQILHTNGTQSAGAKRRREDDDKENRDSDDDRTMKRPRAYESRYPSYALPTIFDPLPN